MRRKRMTFQRKGGSHYGTRKTSRWTILGVPMSRWHTFDMAHTEGRYEYKTVLGRVKTWPR